MHSLDLLREHKRQRFVIHPLLHQPLAFNIKWLHRLNKTFKPLPKTSVCFVWLCMLCEFSLYNWLCFHVELCNGEKTLSVAPDRQIQGLFEQPKPILSGRGTISKNSHLFKRCLWMPTWNMFCICLCVHSSNHTAFHFLSADVRPAWLTDCLGRLPCTSITNQTHQSSIDEKLPRTGILTKTFPQRESKKRLLCKRKTDRLWVAVQQCSVCVHATLHKPSKTFIKAATKAGTDKSRPLPEFWNNPTVLLDSNHSFVN